jgi:DNA-binding LytR/AlgR family response regulator
VHLLVTIPYCLVHVGGFVALRKLVYLSFGQHYAFGSFGELIYEYRKDVLGYFAAVAVFVLVARLGLRAEPVLSATPEAAATFDIREGAKLIRAPVAEILSAHSAGNYVEFHLADGRRPLMRATLASVEEALAPHRFVRTHRSWLVNPKRVRTLAPEGSGDWRVELDGGAIAPLSRRFPEALEALRRPA